jgi:hypothetical protein
MNEPMKLWGANGAERSAVAVAVDYARLKESGLYDLHKRSLRRSWRKVELALHYPRKKDKVCDISTLYAGNAVCLPQSLAKKLFVRSLATKAIELLPLQLGDEAWALINLRVSVEQVRSNDSFVSHIPWLNIVEPRAIEDGWEVLGVPVVTSDSAGMHLVFTDVVVNRIRELGLRGLDFKHVGYIVADASQAVPEPPASPPPPPKVSKHKSPKLTSAPLPADEQVELAEVGAEWRKRLRLVSDTNSETILQRLTEEAQRLRPTFWTISAEERIDASLGLSAIYGELLCKAHGWSWAELRQSRSKQWVSVVSPSHAHALALLPYVQQQMQSEAPTFALLFNMIGAANLPASEPGQLAVVA